MTKSEQIKLLMAELNAERLELEKAEAEIKEYRRKEESFVSVSSQGAEFDPERGYREHLILHTEPAPYGAGNFDFIAFSKALNQFLAKWNEAAVTSCTKNEYKAHRAEVEK